MLLATQLLESAAMCRECAKQFSSKGIDASPMYIAIEDHLHANPGHVVIGTEQYRAIYKEEVCIAR
jgi:hypothetical protein